MGHDDQPSPGRGAAYLLEGGEENLLVWGPGGAGHQGLLVAMRRCGRRDALQYPHRISGRASTVIRSGKAPNIASLRASSASTAAISSSTA